MQVQLTIGEAVLTATLADNSSARSFAAQLRLTLSLRDSNGTEKIADLPQQLPTQDAPDGFHPAAGDVTYYAPWGNLALFYRDGSFSPGLVNLGRLDGDIALLAELEDDTAVRIELI